MGVGVRLMLIGPGSAAFCETSAGRADGAGVRETDGEAPEVIGRQDKLASS